MNWGFLFAMVLSAAVAVLWVLSLKTRIILDGDTITSILPFRAPRSEALDDMTAVRRLRTRVGRTRSIRRRATTTIRIADMRHRAWLTIPAMMPGGRWLFAHLEARAAQNAAARPPAVGTD